MWTGSRGIKTGTRLGMMRQVILSTWGWARQNRSGAFSAYLVYLRCTACCTWRSAFQLFKVCAFTLSEFFQIFEISEVTGDWVRWSDAKMHQINWNGWAGFFYWQVWPQCLQGAMWLKIPNFKTRDPVAPGETLWHPEHCDPCDQIRASLLLHSPCASLLLQYHTSTALCSRYRSFFQNRTNYWRFIWIQPNHPITCNPPEPIGIGKILSPETELAAPRWFLVGICISTSPISRSGHPWRPAGRWLHQIFFIQLNRLNKKVKTLAWSGFIRRSTQEIVSQHARLASTTILIRGGWEAEGKSWKLKKSSLHSSVFTFANVGWYVGENTTTKWKLMVREKNVLFLPHICQILDCTGWYMKMIKWWYILPSLLFLPLWTGQKLNNRACFVQKKIWHMSKTFEIWFSPRFDLMWIARHAVESYRHHCIGNRRLTAGGWWQVEETCGIHDLWTNGSQHCCCCCWIEAEHK